MRMMLLGVMAAAFGVPSSAQETTAQGSDSTISVVQALAREWVKSGGKELKISGGGSSAGIKACQAGTVTFAFSSRELKEAELKDGLVATAYAHDGIAVIVNKENPTAGLKLDELRDLYAGKTSAWSDGKSVVLLSRNTNSGTRDLFDHAVMRGTATSDKAMVKHDGIIISTVAKLPGSIAYTSLGDDLKDVKVLPVDGVSPSADSIRNKTYPLSRTLSFVTKGPPSGDVKAFIEFALGDKGQEVVKSQGYVTLTEKKK